MLDVIGALVDPADTGVAIESFHGKIGKIAAAAKRLDRFRANPFGGFRRDKFRHAAFHQGRQAGNRQSRSMQHHLSSGLNTGRHCRNPKADRLMIDDLLSEHDALARIG